MLPVPVFFLAAEADVQSVQAGVVRDGVSNYFPILDFESLAADELNELALSQLYAILTERDPGSAVLDELIEEHRSGFHEGDGHVWLIQVPAGLVAALLAMAGSEREVVADRWAQEGDFSLDHPPSLEEIREVLDELVAVARSAVENGQSIYARMSYP